MKAKKLLPILALALAFTTLSACSSADYKLTFHPNWCEKPLDNAETVSETLVYKVEGANINAPYDLSYKNGTYTTTLTSTANGYVYETSLSIEVDFGFDNETTFVDNVTTRVEFLTSGNALRPVSSVKSVLSHTPNEVEATTEDACYTKYHYTIATVYDAEGNGACKVTNLLPETPVSNDLFFTYTDETYTYLDNEQLILALRALSNSTMNASVNVYSPYVQKVQKVNLTLTDETAKDFSYTLNGTAETKSIAYKKASIVLGESNPGVTQTVYVAKSTVDSSDPNKHVNQFRNMILYMETPLSYAFGSLTYTLISATR